MKRGKEERLNEIKDETANIELQLEQLDHRRNSIMQKMDQMRKELTSQQARFQFQN